MTAGSETAAAHQTLALGMEKAAQARRDLLEGLREVERSARALGDDWLAEDARQIIPDALIATNGLPLLRVDVVARLSLRISGHRTHETDTAAVNDVADGGERRRRWVIDSLRGVESEFTARMNADELAAISIAADLLEEDGHTGSVATAALDPRP